MVSAKLRERCNRTFGDVSEMKRGVLFDHKLLATTKKNSNSYPYFEGDVYRYEINYLAPSWVEYGSKMKEYPKDFRWFEGSRILLRRLVSRKQRLMAVFVQKTFITNKNLYTILPKPGDLPIEVILAILNSSLVSRLYISSVSQAAKDDFPQVTIKDVLSLPFPSKVGKSERDSLVSLVAKILTTKATARGPAAPVADREIDEIVYRLYGLTKDEVKILEEA
jgi:adenine-specific DNA-methyltransferase